VCWPPSRSAAAAPPPNRRQALRLDAELPGRGDGEDGDGDVRDPVVLRQGLAGVGVAGGGGPLKRAAMNVVGPAQVRGWGGEGCMCNVCGVQTALVALSHPQGCPDSPQ